MDKASGNVIDYSGNGKDGSTRNFEGGERGKEGVLNTSSISFDGNDDKVKISSFTFDSEDEGLSFGGWINPDFDTLSGSGVIMRWKYDGNNNLGASIGDSIAGSTGDLSFEWSNGRSNFDLQENYQEEWLHVFFVAYRDKSDQIILKTYVNGSLVKTGGTSGDYSVQGTDTVILGAKTIGGGFDGKIDEFRIYERNLSDSEVKDLYFNGRPFKGNYSSGMVNTSTDNIWSELKVNATVPTDTSLSANFTALDSSGTKVDSQEFNSLSSGFNNLNLDVADSEDARVRFGGTSDNISNTWTVHEFNVTYKYPE